MNRILKIQAFVVVVLVCLFAVSANAQIGTGWTPYSPSVTTQIRGCGAKSGMVFRLTCAATSGDNRAELRYGNITGQNQFQGTVVVNSMPGDRISLKQVHPLTGGWVMIALKKPGILYSVNNQATLATYTIGTPVRINTITNAKTGTCQIYINGGLRQTLTGGVNPLYDKLGVYRTSTGKGPITATWSNIAFWRK
jgi:hypothetical protein